MNFAYVTHENVPKTLYHYTSLEALVSIVQSKRLRASNIRFLNDRTESLRLKESVLAILNKRVSYKDKEIVRTIVDLLGSTEKQSHFVASLSEKDDLLSQWRAYCPSGVGVSIGFRSSVLNEQWIANPRSEDDPLFLSTSLQKVRYYASEHQPELQDFIERLLVLEQKAVASAGTGHLNPSVLAVVSPCIDPKLLPEAQQESLVGIALKAIAEAEGESISARLFMPGSTIASWVINLAPFVKHEAFEEECEWRKIVSKDNRLMPGQMFRLGKSTLIPFIEIMLDVTTLGAKCVSRQDYFIEEVVIGPTPTPELTFEALRALFDLEGHPEVNLRLSKIPFKDW